MSLKPDCVKRPLRGHTIYKHYLNKYKNVFFLSLLIYDTISLCFGDSIEAKKADYTPG